MCVLLDVRVGELGRGEGVFPELCQRVRSVLRHTVRPLPAGQLSGGAEGGEEDGWR